MERHFDVDRGNHRVVFGAGALTELSGAMSSMGAQRVLIICSERARGLAEMIAGQISGVSTEILAGVKQHVPAELVASAVAAAADADADWILAIGGGSATGLGKAIALERDVKLAVVPTTYSGSEMTAIWGVTSAEGKRTGRDERVRPRLVVYDPVLSTELPFDITVVSLFNAMAHAAEALYAPGVDPTTISMAEEAIGVLARSLEALAQRPDSLSAREDALYGAYLAGACLGIVSVGLHHKLCHVLGGSFGLAHAPTHTVILPHAVRYNAGAASTAVSRIARALGVNDAAAGIYDLAKRTGAPTDLRSLGFDFADVERAAELAVARPYPNPRALDKVSIAALLRDAVDGIRPQTIPRGASGTDWRRHLCGFGSAMQSEALPGALPTRQNSPLHPPYGLYAEQFNFTGFTAKRHLGRRTWLYRIRPSVVQSDLVPVEEARVRGTFTEYAPAPNLLRWRPIPIPPEGEKVDFVEGLVTFGGCGDPDMKSGLAIHWYAANSSMVDRCFYSADGDLLIAPELGGLRLRTEQGVLRVAPGEIALIGRGMKFSVELEDPAARGFILELYSGPFRLPERGPIGANGLADERHFVAPTAAFEDRACPGYEVFAKFSGRMHRATRDHSPYDVVAWHGNYAPYKYDLSNFNAMGSVSFDHPDPSIMLVLTCPLDDVGNTVDVIVFGGRWEVAQNTLRPPYYHANAATEVSMVIKNRAANGGFDQGTFFVSPQMTPHGIASSSFERHAAMSEEQANRPQRLPDESLWLMFESALTIRLTDWALEAPNVDHEYRDIWSGVRSHFDPDRR